MANEFIGILPFLANASRQALEEFEKYAVKSTFQKGTMLAMEGSDCGHFFVLLAGQIRVYKLSDSGREITLYHIHQSESCILTAFCIASRIEFPAFAVAEETCELLLIPAHIMNEWISKFEIWQKHMFNTLSVRLNEILQTLNKAVFHSLDARIADYLLNAAAHKKSKTIAITHEKLAREVGSNRVAVSRTLEAFERKGIIALARGKITIKQLTQIRAIIPGATHSP